MRSPQKILIGFLITILIAFTAQQTLAQNQSTTVAQNPAQSTGILFENVRIFNGQSEQLSPPSNLLVIDNKISEINTNRITPPANTNLTRINGNGRTLMPGLIDNHVHIVMTSSTLPELLSPDISEETLFARAEVQAEQMLLRGFTTIRDLGGPVFQIKRKIDRGQIPGPRIYPSGAMISQTSGHGDFRTLNERPRRFGGSISRGEELGATFIADGRDDVLTATRENLRQGATQIKVMAGGGVSSLYDPIDVTQYTLDEMKAAVEAATDWGTYVTVHAYTPRAVRRAIEAGVKCIEHGQLLDEDTMKILAQKDVWLSAQAFEERETEGFTEEQKAKRALVVQGVSNAFNWAKQYNVKLAWGTDYLFDPPRNQRQNQDIVNLEEWFTPFEALKLVTYDNAQLLKLSGERNPYKAGALGVIEQDAYADLILVDGNPLENLSVVADYTNNFKVIVKDGKIYKNTLS
ncbi:amidohydrolase family protein [Cyanobacterium stanieri LEGE 03274]|uniref:Amidohydrolase family protein n=1 Tax=Cyanobacterium stanieri LEGE 03274 TaxID=1828756 RepID=A0ABR9V6W0_9CHRO|nr:amidohydrolase family protein [Cyanobacterium stanieri]MBE9223618.1 amidohydrolase family protein [Cyanobacterium stanieri LEGE 03274]